MLGHHAIIGKLLALPEFILVIGMARIIGWRLRTRRAPVLRFFLILEVVLMAIMFGPFPDADAPLALLIGFAGIAAMALLQRVHFASLPRPQS